MSSNPIPPLPPTFTLPGLLPPPSQQVSYALYQAAKSAAEGAAAAADAGPRGKRKRPANGSVVTGDKGEAEGGDGLVAVLVEKPSPVYEAKAVKNEQVEEGGWCGVCVVSIGQCIGVCDHMYPSSYVPLLMYTHPSCTHILHVHTSFMYTHPSYTHILHVHTSFMYTHPSCTHILHIPLLTYPSPPTHRSSRVCVRLT